MILNRVQLAQLIAQARRDAPRETCGIIGGKGARAHKIYPLENIAPNPHTRYEGEPHALLAAFRDIEANGWEHLAIYHSHPATDATPSPTDIVRAFYPDAAHLIISLCHPSQAIVRAFRIVGGAVSEITLEIEESENESPRTHPRRATRRTDRQRADRAVATLSQRRPARRDARRARRRVSAQV